MSVLGNPITLGGGGGGGSGRGYATGTYTLASAASVIEISPALSFTPSVVLLKPDFTPDYAVNGCAGAHMITDIDINANGVSDYCYTVYETRTTYATYANMASNNWYATQVGNPSFTASAFRFPCRNSGYPFQVGTYTWEAWE